jgi:shikimate dehydrogenase
MIIGDPVEHSLSPAMHNAGYVALGIEDAFVFTGAHVLPEKLEEAVNGFRALQIKGISVTIPHKTTIMKYLNAVDDIAEKIGAVNTVINDHGKLTGYNTDWIGVVTSLEQLTNIKGKHVALLGAGGAARSVIYGVIKKGGTVTIFNRTVEKAKELAEEFNCQYATLDELNSIKNMDIIFNATSIGLHPNETQTPLPKEYITSKHIVFDAIYTPYQTQLLKDAKEKGAKIIHGQSMLLYQGLAQFKFFTGHDAPEDIMRNVLIESAN